MTLIDTIPMMESGDYMERFKAEYYQLAIRYKKLKHMLDKWDDGTLEFEPACPRGMYEPQLHAMESYLTVLHARAKWEHIDVSLMEVDLYDERN